MFGKPGCDVLQPEPHSGEACNTLSHKGLTNVNIQNGMLYCHCNILKDFLGTVKVATLIFISGRGSVISTAQEWKSGSIHWLSV